MGLKFFLVRPIIRLANLFIYAYHLGFIQHGDDYCLNRQYIVYDQ